MATGETPIGDGLSVTYLPAMKAGLGGRDPQSNKVAEGASTKGQIGHVDVDEFFKEKDESDGRARKEYFNGLLSDWDEAKMDDYAAELLGESSAQDQERSFAPDGVVRESNHRFNIHDAISEDDVAAQIFKYLSVQEIANAAIVSRCFLIATRSPMLWKIKFRSRWNFNALPRETSWYDAYRDAYGNIDDLWVLHWNCVFPHDALSPGRCCIHLQQSIDSVVPKGAHMRKCPSCRYLCDPSARAAPIVRTPAQMVAAATTWRVMHSPKMRPYCDKAASFAFRNASTLHRALSIQQYNTSGLHFLTDVLFFNVAQDDERDLYELYQSVIKSPAPTIATAAEAALHSWHVVHFANPDYHRPIVWRTSIQRPECFTVYPSEGFLRPGELCAVVLGVTPLGSVIAHATHQLNAHREGVDQRWSEIYTDEAHLPVAPFMIHYQFATVPPCRAANGRGPQDEARDRSSKSPWQQIARPNQLTRTKYLSAHVHPNYPLDEFMALTLAPISSKDQRTLAYCAPQLMEHFPETWKKLEHMTLEQKDSIDARVYRTEMNCQICHMRWGSRAEELGQAYVLAKLECHEAHQKRVQIFRCWLGILRNLAKCDSFDVRQQPLLFAIYTALVSLRGTPWMTKDQKRTLMQWEIVTDELYRRGSPPAAPLLPSDSESDECPAKLWRHAGTYRHCLCTDTVFGHHLKLVSGIEEKVLWKDEPEYLMAFAHLAHSPGRFCLGPQEDPNHLQVSTDQNLFGRRQKGFVTDAFMDDPISGMLAAFCMLYDPQSLSVHGIFDRVPYPGSLARRPKTYIPPPIIANGPCPFDMHIKNHFLEPQRYYIFQESLDLDSLAQILTWAGIQHGFDSQNQPASLDRYLRNIPPPGSGRFALSEISRNLENDTFQVVETSVEEEVDQPPSISGTVNASPIANDEGHHNAPAAHLHNLNGNNIPLNNPRAQRILDLLWIISAHFGWNVDDNQGVLSVFLDRRILIGAQWFCISLMVAPLAWTLAARYAQWLPAVPISYILRGLPHTPKNEMRYLAESECGYSFVALVLFWLCLGRYIERFTSRDYFRMLLEHTSPAHKGHLVTRPFKYLVHKCQRCWDVLCPLFLQRLVFTPHWNRRGQEDLMKSIAFWRNQVSESRGLTLRASEGAGSLLLYNQNDHTESYDGSSGTKLAIGFVVMLMSFCAASPHFILNMLTVLSCSISLGLSLSLQSMEAGRTQNSDTVVGGSILKSVSFLTTIIWSFLVGQLVGSSGGVLFLAQYIFNSISLILGGAGAISGGAIESWTFFFCLTSTSFCGYLLGRVAVMEGIRQKRSSFSSGLLCATLSVIFALWVVLSLFYQWEVPVDVMIVRPQPGKKLEKQLQ